MKNKKKKNSKKNRKKYNKNNNKNIKKNNSLNNKSIKNKEVISTKKQQNDSNNNEHLKSKNTSIKTIEEKNSIPNNKKALDNLNSDDSSTGNKNVENIQNKEIKKENIIKFNKEEKNNSKNTKSVKVWFLLLIFVIIFILFFIILFCINFFDNKIQRNIYIQNIDVSKLTAEQAKNKMQSIYSKVTDQNIKCSYNDKKYEIKLEDIDFNLKIDDAVDSSIKYGRNNNFFIAFKDFYLLKFGKDKNISVEYSYNDDILNKKLEEIQNDFYQEVQQYSYKIEENKLKITNGKKGIKIDFDEFKNLIADSIDNKSLENSIEIPLIIDEPESIDVEKIRDEVFVEVKDAYYTTDPFEIHEEVVGVDFDVDGLKNIIASEPEKEEYCIDLKITEPAIKVDNLDLYNDELGRCSTNYVNNYNRTINLKLAANKINGYILMPGETFSYNDVVGERTVAAGYRNAAIYVNGEVEDGLAGGICQISSTLYNAVVEADLEIVERSNHARVPSYLPAGKDATVYWGNKDFKFKNNRSFPVRISIAVDGGYATAIINGKKTENEYDISIETSVVSRYNGYLVVNAYKVYRQNGVVINRELLSTDSYKI